LKVAVKMSRENEKTAADKIWDFMRSEDNYIITEFGVSVIGIGALFFAYAEIETTAILSLDWSSESSD
jgi:hypothetical protein